MELVKSTHKPLNNVNKSMKWTKKELDLLTSCYKFQKGELSERPVDLEGKDISDEAMDALAKSYDALQVAGKLIPSLQQAEKSAEAGEEATSTEEAVAAEETPAEDAETPAEAPAEGEAPEAGAEAEEAATETPAEGEGEESAEAPAEDAETPAEEAPAEEGAEEAAPEAAAEEAPSEEAAPAEAPAAPAPAEVAEEVGKAMANVKKGMVTKADHDSLTKSVKDVADVVKALSEKVSGIADLEKSVKELAGAVNTIAEKSMGRKSMARHELIAKAAAGDAEVNAPAVQLEEMAVKFMKEDNMSFTDAYVKAKKELGITA